MEINLKITRKHILIVAAIAVAIVLAIVLLSNLGGGANISKPSEGLEYEFYSAYEGYMVSSVGTCTDRDIVVPSEYNNYPVVGIASEAFSEFEFLDSIYIPDSVKIIEKKAFIRCINLKKVRFSENLENIGESAFWECNKLEKIIIPNGCKEIGSSAFGYCDSLKKAELPNTITKMGLYIFYHSKNVEVYYSGSMSEWYSINILVDPYEHLYNFKYTEIEVHCKDGIIGWKLRE